MTKLNAKSLTAALAVVAATAASNASAIQYPPMPEGPEASNVNVDVDVHNKVSSTSKATVGDITVGGAEQQQQQQQQQQQRQTNDQSQANVQTGGDQTLNYSSTYKAAKPMGNVAGAYLVNHSECGEGFSLNVSVPYLGVGGGKMKQDRVCLSHKAGVAIMNAGLVSNDDGMIAGGIAALANIHPEVDEAINVASANLMQECSNRAARVSRILLAQSGGLDCDAVNKLFAGPVATANPVPGPVVVQQQPQTVRSEPEMCPGASWCK